MKTSLSIKSIIILVLPYFFISCSNEHKREFTNNPSLSFPTAEGSGAITKGGRGGEVIEVTNLNSNGEGSLREACESNSTRTVVFRVGGTIDLKGKDIEILNSNITIAGQTATGDGIQIKNGGIRVIANEVIIRYLRIRPGPAKANTDALCISSKDRHHRQKNIIVDHVSTSWSVDENVDAGSFSDNITIQWSIIAEGLHNSIHKEGAHSRGLMVTEDSRNITLHHNLFYRNLKRNPLIQSSDADIVNNVMVNLDRQIFIQPFKGKIQVNIVGNYFRSKSGKHAPIRVYDYNKGYDNKSAIYYKDNYDKKYRPDSTYPQTTIREFQFDTKKVDNIDGHITDKKDRYPFVKVKTQNPQEAYRLVLDSVGANYPIRDSVDLRIINEVKSGKPPKFFINNPSDIGGWAKLKSSKAPKDSDHDGMPDNWERDKGLNPKNSLDRNKKNLSPEGYTNLEVYLNGLVKK